MVDSLCRKRKLAGLFIPGVIRPVLCISATIWFLFFQNSTKNHFTFQVLENRTHPVINMSGTGGYLLIATKVVKQAAEEPVQPSGPV